MRHTPPASSVVHGGDPCTLKAAAMPAAQGFSILEAKQPDPSLLAIRNDIEQRRERIARKLSV